MPKGKSLRQHNVSLFHSMCDHLLGVCSFFLIKGSFVGNQGVLPVGLLC
jgi:hypothetical protein